MPQGQILIAHADPSISRRMMDCLTNSGFTVSKLPDARNLNAVLQDHDFRLLIFDDRLPHMDGPSLMQFFAKESIRTPVILVAKAPDLQRAVEAVKMGASDYLAEPVDDQLLVKCVRKVLEPAVNKTSKPLGSKEADKSILTCTKSMQTLLDTARRIAPAAATVTIQGESGTGKELLARYIHAHSGRRSEAFVAMNCAALPENLAESELFGYEKGAFTGAAQKRRGKFEQAHMGTLLLDEISEMPLSLQAKLLRVLQEKVIDRVGGQQPIRVDTRIIATTNCDLAQSVRQGSFREDLYFRLRVIPLTIPPLRNRPKDIPLLVNHFIEYYWPPDRLPLPCFSSEALHKLINWPWPGNVRELQNTVERALLIADKTPIGPEFLLLESLLTKEASNVDAALVGMTVKELEKTLIDQTLAHVNQNRTHAAEMLGISIRTLRNKLREYRNLQQPPAQATGS